MLLGGQWEEFIDNIRRTLQVPKQYLVTVLIEKV